MTVKQTTRYGKGEEKDGRRSKRNILVGKLSATLVADGVVAEVGKKSEVK
jgi:hypothetical protein